MPPSFRRWSLRQKTKRIFAFIVDRRIAICGAPRCGLVVAADVIAARTVAVFASVEDIFITLRADAVADDETVRCAQGAIAAVWQQGLEIFGTDAVAAVNAIFFA